MIIWLNSFRGIFDSRTTAFALGKERSDGTGKFSYYTARAGNTDLPLTDEEIIKHFEGKQMVGVYPIMEGDLVKWAAIDFDKGKDPVKDAFKQADVFKKMGLFSFVERSRSGTGAHVWLFFDKPVSADKVIGSISPLLLDMTSYDMMFPNQKSVGSGYGNLIALPYNGKSYKENKSGFLDKDLNLLTPEQFLQIVKTNRSELLDKLYVKNYEKLNTNKSKGLPVIRQFPGALKACNFCNWIKQAKERMPDQNQEPELYSLACQFAKLEGGKRILDEFAALHPYDQDRVNQKWDRAIKEDKPETCNTIRSKYGDCGKRCDIEIEEVRHPYDLAKISFSVLAGDQKPNPEIVSDINIRVVERIKRVAEHKEEPGWAYGWDVVDDLTEIRKGNLIIMASRPSIGKSAAITDLAVNLGRRNVPSYVVSLEMTKEEIGLRVLAKQTNVPGTILQKGLLDKSDWSKIESLKEKLPLYIDDSSRDIERILDSLGELSYTHGPGPAFIDYLQLVKRNKGENERDALDRVILSLQGMAKILNIPIFGMSQLNRQAESEERDGLDPLDSWLRGSDVLATAPDVIFFLRGKRGQGIVNRYLRIHKDRHRDVGGTEVFMRLNQPVFTFEPVRISKGSGYIEADNGDFF